MNNDGSNETIEYVYIAEKPVSYMQLSTDTVSICHFD